MLKAKELEDQSHDDLQVLLSDKRQELYDIRNKLQREKKIDDPSKIHGLRKDIARIMTVLRKQELANMRGS